MGRKRSPELAEIDARIGLRVRQLREERRLSQAEFARMAGLESSQAVSNYERGDPMPAARMMLVAQALEVSPAAFLEGLSPPALMGVSEAAAPFDSELGDSTQARKIADKLRQAPAWMHPMILDVVAAMVQRARRDDTSEG